VFAGNGADQTDQSGDGDETAPVLPQQSGSNAPIVYATRMHKARTAVQRRTNSQGSFGSSIGRFVQQCLVRTPNTFTDTTMNTDQPQMGLVERFVVQKAASLAGSSDIPSFGDPMTAVAGFSDGFVYSKPDFQPL
jgi:hypothetical protein